MPDWKPGDPVYPAEPVVFGSCGPCLVRWTAEADRCPECGELSTEALRRARPHDHIAADEPGVLWMSMRYALGRATYAVGEVCDAIARHADSLSRAQRQRMASEIQQAIDADAAGMDMDVERWEQAVRVLLSGNAPAVRDA